MPLLYMFTLMCYGGVVMRLQTTTEGLNMLRYGKDQRRDGGGMEQNIHERKLVVIFFE